MASSFDCKPIYNYTALLKSFAEQSDQTEKLEEFLSRLEEERLKIDAFKRELPLCMQLLTNAVEASKQQLQTYTSTNIEEGPKPVLEEFIPLKNSNSEGSEKITTNIYDNKANWMTSAQLWSQAGEELTEQQTTITTSNINEISLNVSNSKLGLDNKQRNGGAFIPFSKDRNLGSLPELALASVDENSEDKRCFENDNGVSCQRRSENPNKNDQQGKENGNINGSDQEQINTNTNNTNGSGTTQSNNRKARRCWSPDLHRRFVNALQRLGGSQVATPKQIRELMKVDGLTNDEVKSHLQKYRLHTRRPSPNPQVAGGPGPQLVVLGGIWVPPEYATAHSSAPTALYGPPHPGVASHAPTHYCVPPVPQDFYSAPPPPPHQLHHHSLHHQLHHAYKTTSHTHSSPESDFRGIVGGDRSESIEDGKSESSSWKGESGEDGGEGKELASFREYGGESINGSEITLKF